MGPRAAWQLEDFGFTDVYDYAPGKIGWFDHGLPREGASAGVPWAGDAAAAEGLPIASPDDRLGDARGRVEESGLDFCLVLNDGGFVLGLLRGDALGKDATLPVQDVMELGPRTIRPSKPIQELLAARSSQGVKSWIVTTSHGLLLGVLQRTDAERALEESRSGTA
jgi:CBS domain-containing protein